MMTQGTATESLRDALSRSGLLDEVHIDAVSSAIATATLAPADRSKTERVAEWAVRMGEELGFEDVKLIRRCALLRHIDPVSIEAIPEVAQCAPIVRCYQNGGVRQRGIAKDVTLGAGILEAAEKLAVGNVAA